MTKTISLYGGGGHAREVKSHLGERLTFFVDDTYVTEDKIPISEFDPRVWKLMVAIGNSMDREKAVNSLPEQTEYFSFTHYTALTLDKETIKIGIGSFIGAYSVLTTNIILGKHSILNRACHIGHDCVIGDFLSMMPMSIISGNCTIGNRVYIGSNAVIREKITICDDVVIGAGAVVVKDITIPGIYTGVPAKFLKSNK